MKTKSKATLIALSLSLIGILSSPAPARCLKDCDAPEKKEVNLSTPPSQNTSVAVDASEKQVHYRERSHDVGRDAERANLGVIHIGHQGTTIQNVGKNATIDNTINSTIVFGDINQ